MGWPVEWLKRMISVEEFDLWCRYYQRQPFDDQSNHHVPLASLQATVANFGGGKKKLTDFLVFRKSDDEKPDLDAKLRTLFASLSTGNNGAPA